MTDHGLPGRAADWLGWTVRHYPWSILWILAAVALAMVASGQVFASGVVLVMIIAVGIHAAHLERQSKRRGR